MTDDMVVDFSEHILSNIQPCLKKKMIHNSKNVQINFKSI